MTDEMTNEGNDGSFEEGLGTSPDLDQDDLSARVQRLEEELLEAKDRYLRQAADIDNMRRRQEKERSDLLKYASEKLLQDLLPVLDTFDKALATVEGQSSPIVEGVKMVQKQLSAALENHGLKPIDAKGTKFDPNIHQGIQRIEDDVDEDTVKDEFQKGYTLNGRLIRPSMVSVSVPRS